MIVSYNAERGDGEGAPIHMPMIRLENVENHRMYCLIPSKSCDHQLVGSITSRVDHMIRLVVT